MICIGHNQYAVLTLPITKSICVCLPVISPVCVHFWWWDNKTNMDCLCRAQVQNYSFNPHINTTYNEKA